MKKLLLTLACAMTSLFASAQAKTAAVGLNLNYGTEIESLGLGVKGSYCFTDHIRGEASFNYFFPKNHFTMWEINAQGISARRSNLCTWTLEQQVQRRWRWRLGLGCSYEKGKRRDNR